MYWLHWVFVVSVCLSVCLSVGLLVTIVSPAQTAGAIEMMLEQSVQKYCVLDKVQLHSREGGTLGGHMESHC